MDLNQLFAGHQGALYNAQHAGSHADRLTYSELAEFYVEQIRRFREHRNLSIYRWA